MDELSNTSISIWSRPSTSLKKLIENENGCYQHTFNDLWELIEDHKVGIFEKRVCDQCERYNIPCQYCNKMFFEEMIDNQLFST